MEMLYSSFAGAPVWAWLAFAAVVAVLLAFDLGVLNRNDHEIGIGESLALSGGYIAIALLFGAGVWWKFGAEKGIEYLTGFFVEKSLSMDNVFVFALIFGALAIPRLYQYRVLAWGIFAALVLRGIFIAAGAAIVGQFAWVLWFFGAFLVFTGIKMLITKEETEQDIEKNPLLKWMRGHMRLTTNVEGNKFWIKKPTDAGALAWYATPLFVALVLVNVADIVFAVDSVPAIFAITQDPFIVYTSNIFAILGLRALYFALAAMIHRFTYLKAALALVLVFVGAKIVLMMAGFKISALVALGVTLALIFGGVVFSLWKTRGRGSVHA